MNPPTPIVIVVGFLGAGKTTFLRELLPLLEARDLDPFVIINDYANARVDAASLQKEGRAVTPIKGDCICCDSLFELMEVLLEVEPTEKRVVLVEANGTTDPPVLLEYLLVHPELRQRYSPILQVAIVDITRWQKRDGYNDLEHRQVETASHILFTREERTSRERFADVREDIDWCNGKAQWIKRQRFALDLDKLVGQSEASRLESGEKAIKEPSQPCHRLSHAFVGFELKLPDPIPGRQLQTWLDSLPKDVLRIKGVVRLAEKPDHWFHFNRVGGHQGEIRFHDLPQQPTVPACAVLIGVDLDEVTIRDSLVRAEQKSGQTQLLYSDD
ncbi:MAG: GTP-binding protein [Verrucomicrobiota bacterium]